jgi:2-octaprenylphenol hydroxylase
VTVLRAELAGLDLLPDHARISLADGRTLTAGLAVGSDGSASLSRKLAGIETSGKDYEQRAFVTHVRTKHSHEHTAWQRFLPKGPIAFLPLVDGRSSIVWTTQPEHAEQLVQSPPEQVGEELEAAIDGVLGKVQVSGPRGQFPLRMSHAQHYCKDHFVLVGDAAHAVHPLAGQGVNLGFLDAAALVQTLAEARAAGSPPSGLAEHRVLRRYERWRKSENAIALGLIDGLNQLFGNANSTVAWARAAGLGAVNSVGVAKQFLIGRAMGIAGEVPRAARVGRE